MGITLGYVGLGHMGGALARRLLGHGPLYVHDLNREAVQRLVDAGATAPQSLAELGAQCDIVLLCLPASPQVRDVLFGTGGLVHHLRRGSMVVDQSTGDPNATREMAAQLRERGIDLVDAPVSGGPRGADAGNIAIMVGASDAQLARVEPVLKLISPKIFHAGALGSGQVIKLANNLMHHAQRLLTLEAVSLAVRNGVSAAKAVEIMLASSGRNYYMEQNMYSRVLAGQLVTGFTLDLVLKDVGLATQLGQESGVPLSIGNLVREYYETCRAEMGGKAEVNAVACRFDRLAGTAMVPLQP